MLLNDALLAVVRGDIKRLLVTMPPRHGKSELISKFFPAWYLGVFPERRIILTSYEADFAASWGQKARDLLEQYGYLFGVQVSNKSSARNRWDIAGESGGMVTAGVGGPITGKGADILLIDDPVKNADEAMSDVSRKRADEWYKSTAYTRLEPNGAVVLIQTRWHIGDLAGMRLADAKDGGEQWHVLNLPAICEDEDDVMGRKVGEALWPERYTVKRLNAIRETVGDLWFSSLYQQKPLSAEGAMFSASWFGRYDPASIDLRNAEKCRFWDLAGTEAKRGSDPDYTVGLCLARKNGISYIQDIRRCRKTPKDVEDLVKTTALQDGPATMIRMEQEPGSSGKATISHYKRNILPEYDFLGLPSTGSKASRARPAASAAQGGCIKINADMEGLQRFLDEVDVFPMGIHDDQVDALSGAYNQLNKAKSEMMMPV